MEVLFFQNSIFCAFNKLAFHFSGYIDAPKIIKLTQKLGEPMDLNVSIRYCHPLSLPLAVSVASTEMKGGLNPIQSDLNV